jgi:hypothetical protein
MYGATHTSCSTFVLWSEQLFTSRLWRLASCIAKLISGVENLLMEVFTRGRGSCTECDGWTLLKQFYTQ